MKRAVKVLLKFVALVAVIGLVALLLSPLWLGPAAKTAANMVAPKIVGTDFKIKRLCINPYTGRVEMDGMNLANPVGYDEPCAVSVGALRVDVGMTTLPTDVIHIEEITVSNVFVSVTSGGENRVLNFTQIQYNVAGGKEKFEAKQAEAKELEKKAKEEANVEPTKQEVSKAKPGKKFVIDRLTLAGVKLKLGFIPISLPSITLKDIGKESEGATFEDVWNTIVEAVMKSAGAVGDGLKALGGFAGDAASKAGAAVGEAAGKTAEVVGEGAKAVGDAAGKAADALGEGAKAVGDGATKAIDKLKSLW